MQLHTMQHASTSSSRGCRAHRDAAGVAAHHRPAASLLPRPVASSSSSSTAGLAAAPRIGWEATTTSIITPSRCRAVAAEPAAAAAAPAAEKKEWYGLVANAEFFFNDPQNESLAEQLRERVRYFKEINREVDFYLVPEPKWLAKYPEQAKKVQRPCVALVSTDKAWIVFMKLRLDRVLRIDMGPVPDAEALAVGGKVPDFKPPEKWTAPYSAYTPGWWNKFIPQ